MIDGEIHDDLFIQESLYHFVQCVRVKIFLNQNISVKFHGISSCCLFAFDAENRKIVLDAGEMLKSFVVMMSLASALLLDAVEDQATTAVVVATF